MRGKNFSLVCYDLPVISAFFRSVAFAIATQKHTRIQWETYRDSKVLNAIYTVLFWKEPPGTAEIRSGDRAVIEAETEKLHGQFLTTWLEKLHRDGPMVANLYVSHMLELREYNRKALMDLIREAHSINAEVGGETAQAIENLAKIRLAATVGVAVIGAVAGVAFAAAAIGAAATGTAAAGGITVLGVSGGASSATFGIAGAVFSTTTSIAKMYEEGMTSSVAAIALDGVDSPEERMLGAAATETAKWKAGDWLGDGGKYALTRALAQQAKSENIVRSAQGLINQHSQRIADGVGKAAKSQNIINRSTQQMMQHSSTAAKMKLGAGAAGLGMKAVPVVFAAVDIMSAWGDYKETVARAR